MGYFCLSLFSVIFGAMLALVAVANRNDPYRNCMNCEYKEQRDRNSCKTCSRSYLDQWQARSEER